MLTFVDLFCGGGFGAWGATKGGGRPLLGVDSWDVATDTYRSNFVDSDVICSRIEDLDPYSLAGRYRPDVLLTSPECTSHSIARGSSPGCELSRAAAFGIVPWLEAMRPRWLIVENVNRMQTWARHKELVCAIENAGYAVSDLHLNAADFGVPQKRKRLFLVCDRDGAYVNREQLVAAHNRKPKAAFQILAPTGRFRELPLYKDGRAAATIFRAERAIEELGEGVPFLIVYYGSDYSGGWQRLDVPLRTVTTLDRFGLVTWHDGEPFLRMLQPEELIRAMGAAGLKLSTGTRRDRVKLCGNGVCAPVIETIFRVLNRLENRAQLSRIDAA